MRFGVISTADIGVGTVIPAIQQSSHDVVAIGSRDGENARAVADELGIDRSYGSYEDLLADEELDAALDLVEEMDIEVEDDGAAEDDTEGGSDAADDGGADPGERTLADF